MSKFYQTNDFKRLEAQWKKKLEKSGFEDIEDAHGRLKENDRRTQAWDNKERIHTFFRMLDAFLLEHPELPKKQRAILELYAQGIYIKEISKRVGCCRSVVHRTIRKVTAIIQSKDTFSTSL